MSIETLPASIAADDSLYEIVNGVRVEKLMGIQSNLIAGNLYFHLRSYLESNPLGIAAVEALLILDTEADLRRRPDVCFVSAERWPLDREVPDVGDWAVVPDLAVEVVSPHDTAADLFGKVNEYFGHGVRLVWVVVPEERQVNCHTDPQQVEIVKGEDLLSGGAVLPGFALPVSSLFARDAGSV